jgi:hypothetical protein
LQFHNIVTALEEVYQAPRELLASDDPEGTVPWLLTDYPQFQMGTGSPVRSLARLIACGPIRSATSDLFLCG